MSDLTEEKLKACQVKPVDTLPYAEEIQNLKEENLMLKGLLRECKPYIGWYIDNNKHFGFTPEAANLLTKIKKAQK